MATLLFLAAAGGRAELQWVTGGVPDGNTGKEDGGGVKDAPEEGGTQDGLGNQDVMVCHMTICTHFVNQYPGDSRNFLYLDKDTQVGYFAYFLMKPSTRIHTATLEWFSPSGARFAKQEREFRVGFTDNLLTLQNETYQYFLLDSTVSMTRPNPSAGQTGVPRDLGQYTVRLKVDGQLVGITFFYVKPKEGEKPPPFQTPVPEKGGSQTAPSGFPPIPLSTPVSKKPLQIQNKNQ